ncbi:MAG: ABC transporter transmembrane domain-containing protein [Elusimicrobia bacterium]|jgi:subfamily B ATP-binding cassette protein MsbA|nr:ABC transporter transmembrane domain-containing protein [Elusimicrobiota bacterium]
MEDKTILKRLYRYIKPYKSKFIVALISLAFVGALTPSMIAMIKPFMDGIFAENADVVIPFVNFVVPETISKTSMLWYFAGIVIIIALLKGIFSYIGKYFMAYIGQNITKDLRNRVFRHLMYLSLSYYMLNATGQLLSRMTNDIKFLESSVVKLPARLIRDGLQLIVLLVFIFVTNWRWALLTIVGFIVIIFPLVKFSDILRKIGRRGHQKMADIYDFLSEKIAGIRLIKAFSMEKEEQRLMKKVNQKFVDTILKSEKINAFQSPVIEFLSVVGIAAILILGGKAVLSEAATPGDFFLFLGLVVGVYDPAKKFAGINQQLQRSLAAAERIFVILDQKDHILQSDNPKGLVEFKDEIEFKDVTFAYEKGVDVLKNINLKIKKGQIAAFVGPSGAGKTTLVNLIPRFADASGGEIILDSTPLKDYRIKSIRNKISMVMQDVILFNMTIKENICYGLGNFTQEEVERYAKAAHIHDFIDGLKEGYNTVVGENGVKLSGGQKQRISIARALIKDPEILILDEATSHLDTESEQAVQKALDNLMENRTTFVIAHRLSTIRKADKIIVLDEGKIVEEGRHEELLGVSGVYRKMFEMQSL